ncbi:GNAT family N-acetyltransferase [Micromonospora krabiensis]|uniref:Protein N-acetyltransferase, RimJ/RimL family n=1 Tax=Micromonospora krabiensis TaxID=307121 RepID=A0A1C3MZ98_9ACTN|nr:GNAT family N-acetyltransferase [Micromonospora krabiensis]SBV25641.1 Protein N-acetyltransferase, RimJ/RimL family [Micromonospora krabiensis]
MSSILRAPARASAPELILRPWRDDDRDALLTAYQDPVLLRWTRFHVTSPADADRWLAQRRQGWADGSAFSFAVLEPDTEAGERLVANVVLKQVTPGRPDAEVGYWTAAPARGRGVAGRALDAMSRWAFARFGDTGLARLELLHQVDNAASCRVAEKTGFRFQEVLPARPPFPRDGHRHVRRADQG